MEQSQTVDKWPAKQDAVGALLKLVTDSDVVVAALLDGIQLDVGTQEEVRFGVVRQVDEGCVCQVLGGDGWCGAGLWG